MGLGVVAQSEAGSCLVAAAVLFKDCLALKLGRWGRCWQVYTFSLIECGFC